MLRLLFSGVSKGFAGRRVIDGLTAEAHGCCVTAVTGKNGSGKSTLLKMAAKLMLPDAGKILAEDGDEELHQEAYRSRLAMVTPDFRVYPKLTVRENLDFFLGFRRKQALTDEAYGELLERVGLPLQSVEGKYAEQLSTGMRKRLHFAILLASGADIWLLDEPGANLDADGRAMVMREARRAAASGKLILWATNDPEEEACADACIALPGH